MKQLYRLKSNRSTIVEKDGNQHKVFWSSCMDSGFNSRWMRSKWNPDNVEPLNEEENNLFHRKWEEYQKRFHGFIK